MRKPKLLIVSPLPPPVHGVTMYSEALLHSAFADMFDLRHLDTSDHRSLDNIGRIDRDNIRLAVRQVIDLCRHAICWKPDVVYLPLSATAPAFVRDGCFVLAASFLSKARIVAHLHGGAYFRNQFYEQSNPLFRWFVRRALRRVDTVIVLSERFRNGFQGLVRRIAVLPNGVPDSGRALPPPSRNERVIIGYLGNLFRSKGIEELVDSAFAVLDRGFDIEMRLAGAWWEKDENFRSEILGRIRRHPGGDRIIFVGVLTGERKVNFLEEIDVLVVPGGYPMEGMPLVILEAMERGKAVVGAMDTGAISDVIEDGKTGLLVPARSVPALADAISMLAGDSVLRTRMGLEGRRIFQTRYTLRRHIEDLVALLRDMVAES